MLVPTREPVRKRGACMDLVWTRGIVSGFRPLEVLAVKYGVLVLPAISVDEVA